MIMSSALLHWARCRSATSVIYRHDPGQGRQPHVQVRRATAWTPWSSSTDVRRGRHALQPAVALHEQPGREVRRGHRQEEVARSCWAAPARSRPAAFVTKNLERQPLPPDEHGRLRARGSQGGDPRGRRRSAVLPAPSPRQPSSLSPTTWATTRVTSSPSARPPWTSTPPAWKSIDGVVLEGASTAGHRRAHRRVPARARSEAGDEIISGCVNLTGLLRSARDQALRASPPWPSILDLVENASSQEGPGRELHHQVRARTTRLRWHRGAGLALLRRGAPALLGLAAAGRTWICCAA